jgi:hypothetical protein
MGASYVTSLLFFPRSLLSLAFLMVLDDLSTRIAILFSLLPRCSHQQPLMTLVDSGYSNLPTITIILHYHEFMTA